eukprot:332186-Pyramimonas_sp.AAC.1
MRPQDVPHGAAEAAGGLLGHRCGGPGSHHAEQPGGLRGALLAALDAIHRPRRAHRHVPAVGKQGARQAHPELRRAVSLRV